ncbi:uncharacterized protein MELLADRAFT_111729 [Melampsora larici-populina 98AG31]|uniref:Uncharacterized protein n=1 Tax=Melampsora larici-populina (strain 98AG31 / pathotype 3-4-7) TaxID=747676 RepID=F4S4C3_MELLP|nr:uncharacterized protein MELLADRAFT_111729 [Melampsora larici-populina 98AG31]EGG00500.1 hypothetical protein MELLADRAFT_111729 [Melampsora larici-populina 98AG31]
MVCPTLIHEYYEKVNPNVVALPQPKLRGPTGLRCPVCPSEMVYWTELHDSWHIGCPTPYNSHNWKTWRCDQLNHELALINLGTLRPIVSVSADWGPRVSTKGLTLPDLAAPPQGGRYHPYQSKPKQDPTTSTAKRAVVQCKRLSEGSVAQNHKKTANKGCHSQYCLGCCIAYGSSLCRVHVRPSTESASTPLVRDDRSLTPHQLSQIGLSQQQITQLRELEASTSAHGSQFPPSNVPARRPAPASQAQPHQWAQTSNSLGRRVPLAARVMLQKNRYDREHAAKQQSSALIDETKVVMITLWTNSEASQIVTGYFPLWPLLYLEQCELLIAAVVNAIGPKWNQALSVWNEEQECWCDTLVSYPIRRPSTLRTLIVKLQGVQVRMPLVLETNLPKNGPPSHPPSDHPAPSFTSLTEAPPRNTPSSPKTPYPSQLSVSSQDDSDELAPLEPEVKPNKSSIDPQTSNKYIDLTLLPDPRSPTQELPAAPSGSSSIPGDEEANSLLATPENVEYVLFEYSSFFTLQSDIDDLVRTSDTPPKRKRWPSSSVQLSSVLAWYKDQVHGCPKTKWMDHFGAQWHFSSSTMY